MTFVAAVPYCADARVDCAGNVVEVVVAHVDGFVSRYAQAVKGKSVYARIGFGYAYFLGNKNRVEQVLYTDYTELFPLHRGKSVSDKPDFIAFFFERKKSFAHAVKSDEITVHIVLPMP